MVTYKTRSGFQARIYPMDHGRPHVHIITDKGDVAKVEIVSGAVVAGNLGVPYLRRVRAWLGRNETFLLSEWRRLEGD